MTGVQTCALPIYRTGQLAPEDREEIVSLAKRALESFGGKKGG